MAGSRRCLGGVRSRAALVTDACALFVRLGEGKRDRVAASRRPEEHDRPITEQFLHVEHIPVEGHGSIMIGDEQMNMSDPYRVHGPSQVQPPSEVCRPALLPHNAGSVGWRVLKDEVHLYAIAAPEHLFKAAAAVQADGRFVEESCRERDRPDALRGAPPR
jgi:hypothetical protein